MAFQRRRLAPLLLILQSAVPYPLTVHERFLAKSFAHGPKALAGEKAPMDINRFTEKAQEALMDAQRRAVRGGQQQVDVEHLLLTLLEQEPGLAVSILRKANVNAEGLRRRAEQDVDRLPRVSGSGVESEQVAITRRL